MDKNLLRKEMKNLRVKVKDKNKKDENICNTLTNLIEINDITNIFIYIAFNDEINTTKIIKWCIKNNKRIFVPRIVKGKNIMEAVEIKHLLQLKKNSFGILEPIAGIGLLDAKELELAIVPGIAFDKKGGRLGYGGGFYDKFFEKYYNCKLIGLTYEDLIIGEVPTESHDIRVEEIITESNVYFMKKNS